MISETEEEDPKLIEFVKSLINLPANSKLKLVNPKRKDFSQFGESLRIDTMLNGLKNGFLVEAGALDGETFSNSLFFERERNWSGILIEPLPLSYQKILKKNRKMYSIIDRLIEFRLMLALPKKLHWLQNLECIILELIPDEIKFFLLMLRKKFHPSL